MSIQSTFDLRLAKDAKGTLQLNFTVARFPASLVLGSSLGLLS